MCCGEVIDAFVAALRKHCGAVAPFGVELDDRVDVFANAARTRSRAPRPREDALATPKIH